MSHRFLGAALLAAMLAACVARPLPQQVVDQDPAALYAKLAAGADAIQRKIDANAARIAASPTPVTFASDRAEGKMLHIRMSVVGMTEEVTVWIEPGPNPGQALLKADVPSRVTRNGGTDLLEQVEKAIDSDYQLVEEVLRRTEPRPDSDDARSDPRPEETPRADTSADGIPGN